ncbi:hypothetical protein GCK72_013541 [Caenorhabditis remanei]|uniref:Histone deacetylase domain-containing protein n=1 Tax=Caenorhabditis remanei TaxID=31234 RepID=A0A6A5GRB9_CAERE|nr:hypothetical protein GCK72_013541 [Caenorhabditis remanei]KAF1757086.1 hypothetical protein GCK72_013541 [Caenorhabditis remanei]
MILSIFSFQSIDKVYEKDAGQRNALVIVRPPGHHASASKSSGFCIFNNVAVAAKYAQRRYKAKRILILDWDVHHGNGTQEIFYEDANVMYMSIHRHDKGNFYPVGEPKDYFDVGEGAGEGMSVNVPFSGAQMGDIEYQMAFQRVIMPISYQFNPDLVLISAGFDAAIDDPLGDYRVTPETFALMTYQLSSLASGRVITVLEGGYNLTSISNSALAVCEVLQNRAMLRRLRDEKEQFASKPQKLESSSIKTIREVCALQQKYWSILKGFQIIFGSVLNSKLVNKNGKSNAATLKVKTKAATDPIEPSSSRRYNTRRQNRRRSDNSEVDDVMAKIENMKL